MLSVLRPGESGLWERIRRSDIERRLALLLTVGGIVSGIATYVAISGAPPFGSDVRTVLVLLNLDLILLLLLGVVIARSGSGSREMFTVRRIVANEGVERKFPLHSPKIEKIEVVRGGVVRRAKLYFLRDRVGKAVRLKERRRDGKEE